MIRLFRQIAFLIACLTVAGLSRAQTANTSTVRTLLWPYELPGTEEYGPMDVMVHGEYYFVRERMGDVYRVHLNYKITSIVYNAKFGSRRFKYNGRIYREDEMNGTDGLGSQGFDQLEITGINIKINAIGVLNGRQFDINENFTSANYIGEISETGNLNGLSLNLVTSYASSIYYNNSSGLKVRIDTMLELMEDREEYKTKILQADAAFRSEDWADGKRLYEDAADLLPRENYPKQQISKCDTKIAAQKAKETHEAQQTQNTTQHSETEGTSGSSSGSSGLGSSSETNGSGNSQTSSAGTGSNGISGGANGSGTQSGNGNGNTAGNNSGGSGAVPDGPITHMSDPVGLEGTYGSIQVYQQNGKYYVQNADGTTYQTTKESYDEVQGISAKNAQIKIDNAKLNNDPLYHYNNPSAASNEFQEGYERGQQIADAVTPLANELVDAWNRKVERDIAESAAREEVRLQMVAVANNYVRGEQARLANWSTFRNQEYVAKIPAVMENPAPQWSYFMYTKGMPDKDIFGHTTEELKANKAMYKVFGKVPLGLDIAKRIGFTLIPILGQVGIPTFWDFEKPEKQLKEGDFSLLQSPACFTPFFGVVVSSYDTYARIQGQGLILNGKSDIDLIYDEEEKLIGYSYSLGRSGEYAEIIKQLTANKELHYLRPDANTFIFKDKVLIIDESNLWAYDLNVLKDRFMIRWPAHYQNIEQSSGGQYDFPVMGIRFKSFPVTKEDLQLSPSIGTKTADFFKDTPSYLRFDMPTLTVAQAAKLRVQIDSLATKELYDSTRVVIHGVILAEVIEGGPADLAGLESMDIVTAINGLSVSAPYQLQWIAHGYSNTRKYQVTYIRNGAEYQTILKLKPKVSLKNDPGNGAGTGLLSVKSLTNIDTESQGRQSRNTTVSRGKGTEAEFWGIPIKGAPKNAVVQQTASPKIVPQATDPKTDTPKINEPKAVKKTATTSTGQKQKVDEFWGVPIKKN